MCDGPLHSRGRMKGHARIGINLELGMGSLGENHGAYSEPSLIHEFGSLFPSTVEVN